MNSESLMIIARDKTWRSAELFHIPTIISSGTLSDKFYEMILDRDKLQKKIPFFYNSLDARDPQESDRESMEYHIIDCLIAHSKQIPAFVGVIECPVFQKGGMYSWGYYQTETVVFDEISQLIDAGDDLYDRLFNLKDKS